MVNWEAAAPIVVAIIGISGVILPVFSSIYINQTYNKPTINIDIGKQPEKGNLFKTRYSYNSLDS